MTLASPAKFLQESSTSIEVSEDQKEKKTGVTFSEAENVTWFAFWIVRNKKILLQQTKLQSRRKRLTK